MAKALVIADRGVVFAPPPVVECPNPGCPNTINASGDITIDGTNLVAGCSGSFSTTLLSRVQPNGTCGWDNTHEVGIVVCQGSSSCGFPLLNISSGAHLGVKMAGITTPYTFAAWSGSMQGDEFNCPILPASFTIGPSIYTNVCPNPGYGGFGAPASGSVTFEL